MPTEPAKKPVAEVEPEKPEPQQPDLPKFPEASLYERLLWVQTCASTIAKEHQAEIPTAAGGAQRFKFASHDDVVKTIRPLLSKARILCITRMTELSQVSESQVRIAIEAQFINVDRPEEREVAVAWCVGPPMRGTGIGAVFSYASKFLFLKFLMLDCGQIDLEYQPQAGVVQRKSDRGDAPPPSGARRSTTTTTGPSPTAAAVRPAATSSGEPPKASQNIPAIAWEEIKRAWHDRGVVSSDQLRRLFAVAKDNGWSSEDVKTVATHHLGRHLDELPWGGPYDKLVAVFKDFKPFPQNEDIDFLGPPQDA